MVVSHDANEIRSTPVPAAANIAILAQGCDVVGIDEAQFFDDEIVKICNDVIKYHCVSRFGYGL
jgi:thymidine kinase